MKRLDIAKEWIEKADEDFGFAVSAENIGDLIKNLLNI